MSVAYWVGDGEKMGFYDRCFVVRQRVYWWFWVLVGEGEGWWFGWLLLVVFCWQKNKIDGVLGCGLSYSDWAFVRKIRRLKYSF